VPKLILFDIDGTLCLTGGAGARAMTRAFEDTFRIRGAFAGIAMAGRTDQIILRDALARVQFAADESILSDFHTRYLDYLRQEILEPGKGPKAVMPGVRELLDHLATRADVFIGLLTGNFAAGARIKLEYFDLWRYFACGAFGDDACERNDLMPIAIRRAQECGAPSVPPRDVIVVGDTPLDVACASSAGARSVAVATGSFTTDRLRAAGADVVFDDLSDTGAFRALLDGDLR
jgi:phosphoglycolate phosphatase